MTAHMELNDNALDRALEVDLDLLTDLAAGQMRREAPLGRQTLGQRAVGGN